jgi:hypothetical protein
MLERELDKIEDLRRSSELTPADDAGGTGGTGRAGAAGTHAEPPLALEA